MPIVEFDGSPSWSLNASETGESTKCLWVGVRGGENRETVTASHCLVFTGLQRQQLIGRRDNRVYQSVAER